MVPSRRPTINEPIYGGYRAARGGAVARFEVSWAIGVSSLAALRAYWNTRAGGNIEVFGLGVVFGPRSLESCSWQLRGQTRPRTGSRNAASLPDPQRDCALFRFVSQPLIDEHMKRNRPDHARYIEQTNALLPRFSR